MIRKVGGFYGQVASLHLNLKDNPQHWPTAVCKDRSAFR